MDLDDFVSSGVDTKLKCFVCQNYLSYFPISLCSNNQSVCGRCEIPEATIAFRNEAFEGLGKLIKFPCRYQSEGCLEALLPQNIPKHEKNCPFRVVSCIISNPAQCEWEGSLQILTQHCHEEHSDIILKNGEFMIDLSISGKCDSLLEGNDIFYIFSQKKCAESKTLSCAIYTNKYETDTKSVSASITVKKENKKLSLDLMTTSFEDMVYTELCLHSLISKNEEENLLSCEVKIEALQHKGYRLDEETNFALLSVFKCSMCCGYASNTPVYRSLNSMKIICQECSYGESKDKDVNLDKIVTLVKYPCKYHESGCTFAIHESDSSCSAYDQSLYHEDYCDYRTADCPWFQFGSCTWKGLHKNIQDHVLNSHQDLIVSFGDVLKLFEKDTEKKCVFLKFSDRLFRMIYCYNAPRCMWSVQDVNCDESNFKYQIEIVDEKPTSGCKLRMRRNCSELTDIKDVFKYLKMCCYFEIDQIGGFQKYTVMEDSVWFTVRVLT